MATLNSPSPSNEDDFGHAVAIIGSKVIVSAFADDTGGADAGRVFVFELASGTPVLGHTLNDPQPMEGDYFGISLCSEGNRVIVGAFRDTVQSVHSGGAFVYDLGGSTPSIPVATLRDPVPSVSHFGFSVAMNSQSVAVGAPSSNIAGTSNGYAYVFGPGSANTAPSVTLTGNNPLTFEAAATYMDPGATAGDAEDGALVPVITSNTVIANVPGTYSVTWTATDSGGLTGSTTRTVNVVDTTPPSIDGDAFFPTTIPVSSLLPDYRGQERSHDAVGVVSTTQSPAPGAYIGRGRLFVNIDDRDQRDV